MKTYRHFIITCLVCGEVWEETTQEPRTVKDVKLDIALCESCGDTLIQVVGHENLRLAKTKRA
jgi:ribosomal protein S27E